MRGASYCFQTQMLHTSRHYTKYIEGARQIDLTVIKPRVASEAHVCMEPHARCQSGKDLQALSALRNVAGLRYREAMLYLHAFFTLLERI